MIEAVSEATKRSHIKLSCLYRLRIGFTQTVLVESESDICLLIVQRR